MNYDELYGISIDEYCKYHNTTIDSLISKTSKDIELLKRRLNCLIYEEKVDIGSQLINDVYSLLQKKERHLERLKKWKRKKNDWVY